jgi:hypothetical protein
MADSGSGGDVVMTLNPSLLPSGAGMSLSVAKLKGLPFGVKIGLVHVGLVEATDLSDVPAEFHNEIRAGAALIIEDLPATPATLDWSL